MATPLRYTTPSWTSIFRRPTFWGMTSPGVRKVRVYWAGVSAFHSTGLSNSNTKGSPWAHWALPTCSPLGERRAASTWGRPESSSSTVTVAWEKSGEKLSFTK